MRLPIDIVVAACIPAVLTTFGIAFALGVSHTGELRTLAYTCACGAVIFIWTVLTAYRLQTARSMFSISLGWFLIAAIGYFYAAPALQDLAKVPPDSAQLPFVLMPLAFGSNLLALAVEQWLAPHQAHGLAKCQERKLLAISASLVIVGMGAAVLVPAYFSLQNSLIHKLIVYALVMTGIKLMLFVFVNNEVSPPISAHCARSASTG